MKAEMALHSVERVLEHGFTQQQRERDVSDNASPEI
jgi:hypothetical protein